jgi:hypothetical protein
MSSDADAEVSRGDAEFGAAPPGRAKSEDHRLMEEVAERSNVQLAYE